MSIPTMDAIISYEDFMKMLENQPSLLPRPNCMCLRAWCKYNANILAQILLPNYPQHGWKGMVLQPALFALINNTPFAPPNGSRPHRSLPTIRTCRGNKDDRCSIHDQYEFLSASSTCRRHFADIAKCRQILADIACRCDTEESPTHPIFLNYSRQVQVSPNVRVP